LSSIFKAVKISFENILTQTLANLAKINSAYFY
jgi:hypothetical protein